jgi:hypothetical protein
MVRKAHEKCSKGTGSERARERGDKKTKPLAEATVLTRSCRGMRIVPHADSGEMYTSTTSAPEKKLSLER